MFEVSQILEFLRYSYSEECFENVENEKTLKLLDSISEPAIAALHGPHSLVRNGPDPEVTKLFSCSTQLSMNFSCS